MFSSSSQPLKHSALCGASTGKVAIAGEVAIGWSRAMEMLKGSEVEIWSQRTKRGTVNGSNALNIS